MLKNEEVYFAGGCLWGVQEFFRRVPGVKATEAGRANGSSHSTAGPYDGYAECVRIEFCICLLYTSPSPRDKRQSRMPSSA